MASTLHLVAAFFFLPTVFPIRCIGQCGVQSRRYVSQRRPTFCSALLKLPSLSLSVRHMSSQVDVVTRVTCLVMLSEFSAETGATIVIPGSNKPSWAKEPENARWMVSNTTFQWGYTSNLIACRQVRCS